MGDLFLVATRKGLFRVRRNALGKWELTESGFLGDPVTMILADASRSIWYAALNLGHFGVKLHRSQDHGRIWEEISAPAFPSDKTEVSVEQIWSLEVGGAQEELLWAGTIPAALFRSEDGGQSWGLNQPLWDRPERSEWFGGGYDSPGIHSICVDPRDARRILVGVSCGGVWYSPDEGAAWELRASGMRAEYVPEQKSKDPNIQDPHLLVQCPNAPDYLWVQHHNGIFRSEDCGLSWHEIANVTPSSFGFAVAVHPEAPRIAWFVPATDDSCRVPVKGEFVVARTRDGGESFELLRDGLPMSPSYDLVFRHSLAVDARGQRLALGSTTGSLWVSEDSGDHWQNISSHLPPIYCIRFVR